MSAALYGLVGALGGTGAASIVTAATLRARRARDSSVIDVPVDRERLSERDRQELSDEFGRHVDAMRRQLTEYADQLAGDDLLLRDRLRVFESGVRS